MRVLLFLVLVLSACGETGASPDSGAPGDAGAVSTRRGVGENCTATNLCIDGATCISTDVSGVRKCMQNCTNLGGACADGSVCSAPGVCYLGGSLPVGAVCPSNLECAPGLVCAGRTEFRCAVACNTAEANRCAAGLSCTAFPNTTAGACEPKNVVGAACTSNADCPAGLMCNPLFPRGACTRPCTTDAECGAGGVCSPVVSGGTVTGGLCVAGCTDSSQCRTLDGARCMTPAEACQPFPDPGVCTSALQGRSVCARAAGGGTGGGGGSVGGGGGSNTGGGSVGGGGGANGGGAGGGGGSVGGGGGSVVGGGGGSVVGGGGGSVVGGGGGSVVGGGGGSVVGGGGGSVVGGGGGSVGGGGGSVFGHPAGTLLQTVALAGGPVGVTVTRDGGVYVALITNDEVAIGDLAGRTFAPGRINVTSAPFEVTTTLDGRFALVGHQNGFAGPITVIDTATNTVARTLATPGGVVSSARDPLGGRLFFGLVDSTSLLAVTYVQADAGFTTRTVPTGFGGSGAFGGIAFDPSSEQLMASHDFDMRAVRVAVDGGTSASLALNASPKGLAWSASRDTLYIANEVGLVQRVSASTMTLLAPIPGTTGAWGVALTRDEAELWLTNSAAGTLFIVNLATDTVRTVTGLGRPRRIAFDPVGTRAVITNDLGSVHFFQ